MLPFRVTAIEMIVCQSTSFIMGGRYKLATIQHFSFIMGGRYDPAIIQ